MSKESLADVGLMVPSHERGFQERSRAWALSACCSSPFISMRRERDRGLVLLRQVELALLFKTRARVALAEGLVLGPFLGELLGDTALRRNGPGPSGLVLRAGRRRGGNLTPLECLVEAVELRKDEFGCLGSLRAEAAGLRLHLQQR